MVKFIYYTDYFTTLYYTLIVLPDLQSTV